MQPQSPYELVLSLLEKKSLDLTVKNLIEILNDFWQEIQEKNIPLFLIGDFLIAFSKLLVLKIDYLLKNIIEKPALVLDLERYKIIKQAVRYFRKLVKNGPKHFQRRFIEIYDFAPPKQIFLDDLTNSIKSLVIDKFSQIKEEAVIKKVSLDEAFKIIEEILQKEKELVLQERIKDRELLVAVFLALLLLFKENKITIEQTEVFGKIRIQKKELDSSD